MPSSRGSSQNSAPRRPSAAAGKATNFAQAGIIERVELTNFMCHSNLALNFNPRVNFIVGKNGSGKSAIMTGLTVVLGARASDTSRGKSLPSFVKLGCSQAKVKIVLSNSGHGAYKPEKYGNKIVLVRTITSRGTNTLHVNTVSSGSVKITRGELTEILLALNISYPNPFALLDQETMKTFLNNRQPKKMYNLVEQGTGISEIKKGLASLQDKHAALAHKKNTMLQHARDLEEELKVWTDKQKKMKRADDAMNRLRDLELEQAWVSVTELEEEIQKLERVLQRALKDKENQEKSVEKLQKEQEELKQKIRIETIDHTNAKALYLAKKQETNAVQEQHQEALCKVDTIKGSIKTLEAKIKSCFAQKKDLQAEIKKITNHSADEEIQRRAQRLADLEQQKVDLKTTRESLKNVENCLDDQRQKARGLEQETVTAKNHIQNITNDARQMKQDLDKMKREANSLNPAYGNRMAEFRAELDRAANRGVFKHKPIGPIGLEIKLHDYSWSLAVENYLRGEMKTFFCDNFDDRKHLDAISKKVLGYPVQCVVSRFFDNPFDVSSRRAVPTQGLVSLYDLLDVKDPRVMNYLVDQRRVESVLLCDDTTRALQMMQKRESVPRGCILMLTKDAEQVYPNPSFKVYGKEHDVEFLVQSREANLEGLAARIQNAERRAADARNELRQIETQLSAAREEVASLNSQRNKMNQKITQLGLSIRHAEDEQETGTIDNFDTLQEELRDMERMIEEKDGEKLALKEQINEAEELKKAIRLQLTGMSAEFKVLSEKCDETFRHKCELEQELDKLVAQADTRKKKQVEYIQRQRDAEANLEEKRADLARATEEASAVGPRLDARRQRAHIEKELTKYRNTVQAIHADLEPSEVIDESVNRLSVQLVEEKSKMEIMNKSVSDMKAVLDERQGYYGKNLITTFTYIGLYFHNLFESQPMEGNIDVKLQDREMVIKTTFKGKGGEGARNLSGGERSFTTVALVLAVWSRLLIPFYMLDEFDVFMDMANRRRAMDMLLAEANDRRSNQFIFFTPQEMSLEADSSITIHKLSDPRSS